MRLHRLPEVMQRWLPGAIWQGPTAAEPTVYLTFDDGPIPEETPWVLEQLAAFEAKAVFFCVGDNVERHPAVARQVLAAGHRLGNHTHHHISGWSNSQATYLAEVARCQQAIEALQPSGPKLFRPPYGRITPALNRALQPAYRIIMWDVLTCDYDRGYEPERCLRDSLRLTRPGSVVVFHDSLKASRNLRYVLPRYLAELAGQGYRFGLL
ncbi:polysaccharide deacetylase family protein [Hymenobacter oligotrophus]|uniref:Polysaccharide deacetylase family protein n=1 Tax=Hymenobacter oligotrophus TaxID=2319843 RepID=A0A3B7R608_9BACT|nr:polysaccharide deacetylase family protein [Hymenobacter oligotrophus]AYA36801.1 polysaccharide deacetylase family protein [Hymenobacter oligotrophus]